MPLLQRRKPGHHCCFRAAGAAAGLSFRHSTFLCRINLWVRESVFCSEEKTQKTTSKGYPTPQKKAVLLKNCSNILNSRNDNSIRLPSGEEKPPEVPFNRLSFLVFQTKRKLSYYAQCFFTLSSLFLIVQVLVFLLGRDYVD